MKGLAKYLNGSKKSDTDEEQDRPSASDAGGSSEEEYARLALEAAKDGDKDAWTKALIGTVRACIRKAMAEDEDEEDGENPFSSGAR